MSEIQKKKWAVVLGVSNGTGAAIARFLAKRPGYNIVGFHRGNHPDKADTLKAEIESEGVACEMIVADAGDPESISGLGERILEKAGDGGVKFFVHSIADGSYGSFVSGQENQLHHKQMHKTFNKMAHSFVLWAQVLKGQNLLAPKATLLGLTSTVPDSLINGLGLISAAKAALEIYVRHLAMELGPVGHRVSLLKFGLVETDAIRLAIEPARWEKVVQGLSRATPAGRLITVQEVAEFVSVLAAEETDWFNGSTIDFSGGQVQSLQDIFYHPQEGSQNNVKYVNKARGYT